METLLFPGCPVTRTTIIFLTMIISYLVSLGFPSGSVHLADDDDSLNLAQGQRPRVGHPTRTELLPLSPLQFWPISMWLTQSRSPPAMQND